MKDALYMFGTRSILATSATDSNKNPSGFVNKKEKRGTGKCELVGIKICQLVKTG